MSFQDLRTGKFSCEIEREKSQQFCSQPGSSYVPLAPLPPKATTTTKKTRSIVLHGKVLTVTEASDDNEVGESKQQEQQQEEDRPYPQETVRQTLQRRSTFSKLSYETEQYQKLVTDLERIMEQSGEAPEAAWRAKILINSAQETDRDLRDKLYNYERTLLTPGHASKSENEHQKELRTAQSACMKLHRDFNRSHKALVLALRTYEKRQKAEVSRLKNVGWSEDVIEEKADTTDDQDFFDRAMRERDLRKMNRSMHQVNQIYQELATMVDAQQDDINELEDDARRSRQNVDDAFDHLRCANDRNEPFCGAMSFMEEAYAECGPLKTSGGSVVQVFDDDGEEKMDLSARSADNNIRVSESFNWYMPFETFREDMKAVHRDIMAAGKDMLASSGQQQRQRRVSESSY